ncbi:hypothetical protein ES332_D10G192900v1 [Gossypium tomentosum]|uniref:Uncharacterized protein n=1 Tax=Gossypium tomentosum TaxID=34277 RepID=A0A5D2J7F8_GOSTO|nr:hypothetical protein ES332_D10G192900v1 [Gossypium tomentosum]
MHPNIIVDSLASVDATTSVPVVHPSTNVKHVVVVTAPTLMMPPFSYAKSFLEISKIDVFDWKQFQMIELWVHANKECKHAIISTILNELFYNITLLEEFATGNLLIEKFLPSCRFFWWTYTHLIIEDTNCKKARVPERKEISTLDNLIDDKPKRGRGRNDNPARLNVNLVEKGEKFLTIISQVNIVTNEKEWLIDSVATRHICVSVGLLGKVGVKVSFESDKVIMTRNIVFLVEVEN